MIVRCVGEGQKKQSRIALNVGTVCLIKQKIISALKILRSRTALFVFKNYCTQQKGIFH